jgi:hypothetical protein
LDEESATAEIIVEETMMPNINALGSSMKAAAATPASWRNFSTFAPTQSARCGTGYSREVLRRAQATDPQNRDSALIFWDRSAWSTLFSANVSRAGRLRALVNDREPIVTEREPEAIPIVSEREPKMATVCEPGRFHSQAATSTDPNPTPGEVSGGYTDWTDISAGDTHACAIRTWP